MAWPMDEPTATPAAVLAICPKRPGPWLPACEGGAAGELAGGCAAVVAGLVCCLEGATGRAGAATGRDGARPPPDLPCRGML